MPLSPLAGKPAPADVLIDVDRLVAAYYDRRPDPANPRELVAFGTSGHRGAPEDGAFNEAHILAITQAICEHRARAGHHRPAVPRRRHARGVGAGAADGAGGAGGERRRDAASQRRAAEYTPTPALSRAILSLQPRARRGTPVSPTASSSRRRTTRRATAASSTTRPTAAPPTATSPTASRRAPTSCCARRRPGIRRVAYERARKRVRRRASYDFLTPYVEDLPRSSTSRRSRAPSVKLGADPMGGASVQYWPRIAERFQPRPDGRQQDGRPALRVHAARSRRQDPHGLLQPVRDGEPARAARTASPSRSATTPTPTATASSRRGRPDEPEPLPGGRHRLPLRAPAGLAGERRHRQDAGVEHAHRSRGRQPRPRGCARCRSASSGSSPGLLDGSFGFGGEESAGASFLRRDGRRGPPTRTASSWTCWPPRSPR